MKAGVRTAVLVALPCVDVITEIGVASAFPQLRAAYGSVFRASVVVSVSPLFAVVTGWIWGMLANRVTLKRVVAPAIGGWSVVTVALGAGIAVFEAALVLRALQGVFAAGFAALPFIALSRDTRNEHDRAKRMGMVEVSISAGAIAAPVTVGTLLAVAPQAVLSALGGGALVLLGLWLWAAEERDGALEREAQAAASERGSAVTPGPGAATQHGEPDRQHPAAATQHGEPAGGDSAAAGGSVVAGGRAGAPGPGGMHIARWVMLPTLFASGIALILGAFETLIPTVAEDVFDSVMAGKSVTMAFEVAVVCGIVYKARRPGIALHVPLLVAGVIGAAYVFAGSAVWLMVFAGLPVGAGVTMGNEYAAASVAGFEEVGMGLYSTLRITGSFLGPLVMNVAYPHVLLLLAAVSLACGGLLLPGRGRDHGTDC